MLWRDAPSSPDVQELVRLFDAWRNSSSVDEREKIWLRMLAINADQVYTIGIVTRALQPIVIRDTLRNVPAEGIYSWDPGAYLGMYHPDTFARTAGQTITIVVRARDDHRASKPKGKQSHLYHNAGCHYTRTTGIWRPVWLDAKSVHDFRESLC